MRAEQYQRQLDVVTDYIYAHLDEDLSLETLAHVSGFSRYHWHRIYRAVRGETAAQTVRRLRLERAAAMLTETSWPVERIAWKAGFTGTEVFSRAFLRAYRTTPQPIPHRWTPGIDRLTSDELWFGIDVVGESGPGVGGARGDSPWLSTCRIRAPWFLYGYWPGIQPSQRPCGLRESDGCHL